jgi:hypothetical protein
MAAILTVMPMVAMAVTVAMAERQMQRPAQH